MQGVPACGYLWGRSRAGRALDPALGQAEAVLELGDAELELLVGLARDQSELVEDRLQARARALGEAGRIAAPAGHRLLDRLPGLVPAQLAAAGEIARQL